MAELLTMIVALRQSPLSLSAQSPTTITTILVIK